MSFHLFSSTFKGTTFNDSFFWILGHINALPINVCWGSIIVTNIILYPTSHSSVMRVFYIVYYTLFIVWNCATSSNNCGPIFITFFFSFRQIVTWFRYPYIFQVTMQLMFIPIPLLFLVKKIATCLNLYNNYYVHIWILTTF